VWRCRPGQGVGGVDDLDDARRGADGAGVADLAARLGVERRPVEEHLDGAVGSGQDGDDDRLGLGLLAPVKSVGPEASRTCRYVSRADSSMPPPLRASLARRRCAAISAAKPSSSTCTPRSATTSRVTSSGKP
jgi:hypothetical protein